MTVDKTLKNYIWFERYRPKELSDIVLPKAHREIFEQYIEDQSIPHILLYGPAGAGKTTLAHILIDKIKCHSMVLNAGSKDRGIETIKGKVKEFAASMPIKGHLKIIFMDEADGLTPDAQVALKNTMETYSSTCRFIFTANAFDKIKREIKSRCTTFAFEQYPIKRLKNRLEEILSSEKKKADAEDIEELIKKFYPDIRSIINSLQAGCMGSKFDMKLTATASVNTEALVNDIMTGRISFLRKTWAGLNEFTWLYRILFDELLETVEPEKRAAIAIIIAEYMYRDVSVMDREINMTACCLDVMGELGCKIAFSEKK